MLELLGNGETSGDIERHSIVEVVKWLQTQDDSDVNKLCQIEWAYLDLLNDAHGAAPRTLVKQLATDPVSFAYLVGLVFRSDKVETSKVSIGEKEKAIAHHAYRLLRAWKSVPGTQPDGSFDGAGFSEWLSRAKSLTSESGHLAIAMSQVGQVLPYAPPDPDGLWIHKAVADVLNDKGASEIRSGFSCELFNMRGVYNYSAGAEEKKIAQQYREKADVLDSAGYHRFAATIREVANTYIRDAEREASSAERDE